MFLYIHKKMRTNIRYTETLKQVLGMIIIPIVYIWVFTAFVLWLSGKISEDVLIILIFTGIILVMWASVLTIFKLMMEAGEAVFDGDGLHIILGRSTFLYPHKEVFIPFSNIAEAGFNEEPGKGPFINLKTRVPKKSIMIFSSSNEDTDSFSAFWLGLQTEINRKNLSAEGAIGGIIKKKGFYESAWVRGIAIFSAAMAILLTILRWNDPDIIAGWKLLGFYCYVIPLCYLAAGKHSG